MVGSKNITGYDIFMVCCVCTYKLNEKWEWH